jgi:threonine dehydrogenase-like Zn-dependent dehydrogenase
MRATVMYGAGDVRVEEVPDAQLVEPGDALVRVTRAAICGSDLWPYKSMEADAAGRRMGHEFIGVVEAVGADVTSGVHGGAPSGRPRGTDRAGPRLRPRRVARGCAGRLPCDERPRAIKVMIEL